MNTSAPHRAPSLRWRVTGHLLVGFVVVYFVLLAALLFSGLRRESGELDRETLRFSKNLALALDAESSPTNQASILQFVRKLVDVEDVATDGSLTTSHARIYAGTIDRRVLNKDPMSPTLDIFATAEGVSSLTIGTKTYRVYTSTASQWRVLILDDTGARFWLTVADVGGELAVYVSIAVTIILLAMLLSMRTMLLPLNVIAASLLNREANNTTPIRLPIAYRELTPVLEALSRLFERVAVSIRREKGFVQNAAHELRTPLAVIAAQADVLAKSEGENRVAAKRHMENAIARASHLTQQLLHVARADADLPIEEEHIDIMNVIRDSLAAFAPEGARRNTELTLAGPDSLVAIVDQQRLRSILDNLVDNALRYGAPSAPPESSIDVVVEVTQRGITLSVSDAGSGVPPHLRAQAFERFWRAPDTTERGAGLGLAIVSEAVLAMHGQVRIVDTAEGRGCTVIVELPLAGMR